MSPVLTIILGLGGVCLLLVALRGAVRVAAAANRPPAEESAADSARAELLSLAHDLELPSYKVVAGICDPRDLSFIEHKAPALRRTLVRERGRLARLWLSECRQHLNRLLRLHRLIERSSENLSVAGEFGILSTYLMLQSLLWLAEAVVIVAGPFRARSLGLYAMETFEKLSATIALPVASLDAGKKAAIRADWARAA